MSISLARSERQELCELMSTLGPDAPTLCAGWTAFHLAAHLHLRESDPVAAAGIAVPALKPTAERRMAKLMAEAREKGTAKILRHPAFMLPTTAVGTEASVLLSAGVAGRAAAVRLLDGRELLALGFKLGSIVERGSDHERYALDVAR